MMGEFVCKFYTGESYDHRTGKSYEWSKTRSHRSEVFCEYYDLWYPRGHKTVPCKLCLTPISLAVWFADDGYIRHVGGNRLQLKLSTHGFDIDGVERLCALLTNRCEGYFGITLEKGRLPIIYASDEATREFIKEMEPAFPKEMNRKAIWRNIPKPQSKPRSAVHLRKTKNGKRIDQAI